MKALPKILFFIKGGLATDEQKKKANGLKEKANVCFRNVNYYTEDTCLEQCDFVLGLVPKKYLKNDIPIWGNESKQAAKVEGGTQMPAKAPQASQPQAPGPQSAPKWTPNA